MPRQKVKVGDVFWVPIESDTYVLGQIIEEEKEVLNSITCSFFDCTATNLDSANLDFSNPISCQFVTRDLFNNGNWVRVNNLPNQVGDYLLPYREAKNNGWIGAKVIGSGNIKDFLSAFYGMRDWHEMFEPKYYENLLLNGVNRKGD